MNHLESVNTKGKTKQGNKILQSLNEIGGSRVIFISEWFVFKDIKLLHFKFINIILMISTRLILLNSL